MTTRCPVFFCVCCCCSCHDLIIPHFVFLVTDSCWCYMFLLVLHWFCIRQMCEFYDLIVQCKWKQANTNIRRRICSQKRKKRLACLYEWGMAGSEVMPQSKRHLTGKKKKKKKCGEDGDTKSIEREHTMFATSYKVKC